MASKTEKEIQASEKSVDDAFQTLLSSQRAILGKMNFGSSTSELQFTEGPDNLPLVSPHASAEFENSYSGYHYHQQSEYYYRETLGESRPSLEIGNDRLILDSIALGPEIFDDETENRMRRKRETEQEFMEVVAQRRRKKQRRGSVTIITRPEPSFSDDLLPGPGDLDLDLDFDESSDTSLLLDDIEFPSMHSRRASLASTAPEIFEELPSVENNAGMEAPAIEDETVEDIDSAKPEPVKQVLAESQQNMRKQRSRPSVTEEPVAEMPATEDADQKSAAKPQETKGDSTPTSDSCIPAQVVEGTESPMRGVSRTSSSQSQQSRGDMDADMEEIRCRANSSDSAADPQALSVALQQSIGSMKSIEEWDKKFGLKRSHSKTMRLSSKSREQLLAFFGENKQCPPISPRGSIPPTSSEEKPEQQNENSEEVDEPAMVEA